MVSLAVFMVISDSAQDSLHAHALCVWRTQQRIAQVRMRQKMTPSAAATQERCRPVAPPRAIARLMSGKRTPSCMLLPGRAQAIGPC